MKLNTWFERDRQYVGLETDEGETILEFWDDDVTDMVESGFLNPRDWQGSMIEYARHIGIKA